MDDTVYLTDRLCFGEYQMNKIKIESDKPVVVIPIDEYEGMKETIEILSSYPNIAQELKDERAKIDKGEYVTYEDYKKTRGI